MLQFLKQKRGIYLTALFLITILLNLNTISNKYALDDNIVIVQNLNTQAGFSGIDELFSTDAFQGYMDFRQAINPISGGRYRPLSIASFAVEQSLFGETFGQVYRSEQEKLVLLRKNGASIDEVKNQTSKLSEIEAKIVKSNDEIASIRHSIQLIFLIILILVIFDFLSLFIFKENIDLAFLCTLIFLSHPVHSEVIANLKSRDELFSLLFIILTLKQSFLYIQSKSNRNLFRMSLFFILALFSKEYALILPIIIGLAWISLYKINFKEIFNKGLFYLLLILGVFVLIRFALFGNSEYVATSEDVLNNPYLFATPIESFSSKVGIFYEYLRILFFPISLSSDYSYAHFSYLNLTSFKFILSAFTYILLGLLFLRTLKKKSDFLFPLSIFLGFFFLVNNILFSIGATMGERLIFHSSLGFCIILFKTYEKYGLAKFKLPYFALLIILISAAFSYKAIERNSAWKDNYSLFTTDVKTVKNSALANNNAGFAIYNEAYQKYFVNSKNKEQDKFAFQKEILKSIPYFTKATKIHKKYVSAYQNLGLCYFYMDNKIKAAEVWSQAAKNYDGPHVALQDYALHYLNEGFIFDKKNDFQNSKIYIGLATQINPYDSKLWENYGGVQFKLGELKGAIKAFQKALEIDPSSQMAFQGMKTAHKIDSVEQLFMISPTNQNLINELHLAYKSCGIVVSENRLINGK